MDTYTRITQRLAEVVDEQQLKDIIAQRSLSIYWGTATTGLPHVGYFVPILKIADFLQAGCHVKILFADMHAYLHNMKSSWEVLEYRMHVYELIIQKMLELVGVSLDKLTFVKGTDYQLDKAYTLDVYKLSAMVTTRDTQKAGAEVVKQIDTPKMSSLLYPILQALDEEYLQVDAQFGGVDQRKIFMFAREHMPRIGYKKRIHLLNPLIPGLGESGKMSSSEPNSKVDFLDTDKHIQKKINKAFSVDGTVEQNGLLALCQYVIFPYLQQQPFIIERPEQYGGTISYATYEALEQAFAQQVLSSIDLKQGVSSMLIQMISPIREMLNEHADVLSKAYPK